MPDDPRRHQLYTQVGPYFVSTNLTFDAGWETMVFRGDGSKRRSIDEWTRHYRDARAAKLGHEDVIIALQRHAGKILPRRDIRGFASRARTRSRRVR